MIRVLCISMAVCGLAMVAGEASGDLLAGLLLAMLACRQPWGIIVLLAAQSVPPLIDASCTSAFTSRYT